MILHDSLEGFREFWREFSRVKSGLVGLAILIVFVFLGVFGRYLIPFPDAQRHWHDITYWQDNPQAAPPVWFNLFSARKGAPSATLTAPKVTTQDEGNGVSLQTFTYDYNYVYDLAPRDIIIHLKGVGQVPFAVTLVRPDGLSAPLYQDQVQLSSSQSLRLSMADSSASNVVQFVTQSDSQLGNTLDPNLIKPIQVLFSKLDDKVLSRPQADKGKYQIQIQVLLLSPSIKLETPSVLISGYVSGLLGTDLSKRDLFTGVIIGIRWALIIGILTSVVSVVVGVLFGIMAAYLGGAFDWFLTRLYELIYLLPVLPFLIVISAIFKPSIWTLIIIICLFFWTGSFKTVYSMALQIKEETFVEASRALGSTKSRIMLKHISPILLPYSFASMALSIPAIIVYEASVSLLGLGDATIVSWGQILQAALSQGAVINRLWWWVIPPGLMIALMGMSFAFLGTALDKILHPKLKTR